MSNTFLSDLIKMYPQVPFQQLLGIEVLDAANDTAVVKLPFRQELAGGGQAFHGGVISSLLDLTGALAAWSGHDTSRGTRASTVSLTTNFLAAAQGVDIVASARAIKRGKELIFCEVQVTEEKTEKLIANGTMIYRIV